MKSAFLKGTHARYGLLQVKKVYFWGGNGTAQRRRDMKASVLERVERFALTTTEALASPRSDKFLGLAKARAGLELCRASKPS